MITCKDWLTFLSAAVLLVSNASTLFAAEFKYSLEPRRIEPGQRATLQLTLDATGLPLSDSIQPTVKEDLILAMKDVKVLERDAFRDENKYRWRFEITGYKLGKFRIPPVEVQAGPESYSTEATEVEVVSQRPDSDSQVREEFGEVRVPLSWKKISNWALGIALIALIAGLTYYLLRQAKLKPPKKNPQVSKESEEDVLNWLKERLQALRNRLASGESRPRVMDDLTGTLREYYQRSTDNPVKAWTTREFHERLTKDERAEGIFQILEQCDRAKYEGDPQQAQSAFVDEAIDDSERIILPWGR